MFKFTGASVVPLTGDYVHWFCALPTYGGDRDRDTPQGKRRIEWLRHKLIDGTFYSPSWAIAEFNGTTYRIDGGHSSRMIDCLNGDIPSGLTAVIRTFTCGDKADMAHLFDQFDARRSMRTGVDKIRAHKAVESSLSHVSPTCAAIAVRGIAFWESQCGEETAIDEDQRIGLLHEHQEFVCWSYKYLKHRYLNRMSIAAAMFETSFAYSQQTGSCTKFWDLVATEGAEQGNATRTLASFLRDTFRTNTNSIGKRWDGRAIYCKCIHAWNAWVNNTTTQLKYTKGAQGLPKALKPRNNRS